MCGWRSPWTPEPDNRLRGQATSLAPSCQREARLTCRPQLEQSLAVTQEQSRPEQLGATQDWGPVVELQGHAGHVPILFMGQQTNSKLPRPLPSLPFHS